MRVASVAVPVLGLACGCAFLSGHRLDGPEGPPRPIRIVSAKFGGSCKGQSDDVGPLFRGACEGKWRCAVRLPRQLSATQKKVEEAARETCYGATYTVNWTCAQGTGVHTLTNGPGARLRLSCLRPGPEDLEATELADKTGTTPAVTTSGSSQDVHGRLLATAQDDPADQQIVVRNRTVPTDEAGVFKVSDVPPTYDLSVVGRKGKQVSIYLDLSRRDPVVTFTGWRGPIRGASVTGRVAGPEMSKTRLWSTLHFFSPLRPNRLGDAGFFGRSYPDEIPDSSIGWTGPPTLSGRMLVFIVDRRDQGDGFVGIASKTITLDDGDSASEDLTAVKLSSGHIVGTWNPARNPQTTYLSISYELDDGSGEFWVAGCGLRDSAMRVLRPVGEPLDPPDADQEQAFDCPLRDVSFLPGRYRVFAMGKDNDILDPAQEPLTACSIRLDRTGASLPCQRATAIVAREASPNTTAQFTSLARQEMNEATRDSVLAWEGQRDSTFAVELEPVSSHRAPRISLFTSRTSFRWSDLDALGVGFPAGATYQATVGSLPVSSMDEIASFDWWYAPAQRHTWPEPEHYGVKLSDPSAPVRAPRAPK
jgi:hypothetical protein